MVQEIPNKTVRIVPMSAELLPHLDYLTVLNTIEQATRNCYRSALKDTVEEKEEFIRKNLIKTGHESPLEHVNYTMAVIIDRGILAEWTRHRVGSAYSVESTRYVNYRKQDNEIIIPSGTNKEQMEGILNSAAHAIWDYQKAVDVGCRPEQARALLPQCLVVHMVVSHNIRQWRHVFKERLINHRAHPDFRRILGHCLPLLYEAAPVFFEDIHQAMEETQYPAPKEASLRYV